MLQVEMTLRRSRVHTRFRFSLTVAVALALTLTVLPSMLRMHLASTRSSQRELRHTERSTHTTRVLGKLVVRQAPDPLSHSTC